MDTGSAFTGGTGDDTFSAQDNAGTLTNTLTTGDNLVGGAGTDTLSIAVSGTPTGATTAGVVTSGIEALTVYNNSTAAYEADAALMAGLSDVYVSGGTFKTTVDDVDTIANLHLLSTNVDAELSTTAAAVVGLADEATILSNASAQSANVTATYDGVEIINFAAAGPTGTYSLAKSLAGTAYALTLDSDQLEKVVVTGDADVNLTVDLTGADLETQTSEFDASAAGGSITAHITKGDSATAAVTMSAQADHLDYNGALANTITLDGGDGADTLELDTDLAYSTAAATAGTAQAGAGVSNFESLYLASGVDVDERALSNNAGITSVIALAGGSYTKSTALASVTQLSSGTFTTTAATDGAADTLTLAQAGAGVSTTLSAANVEALTVSSGGTAANTVTMTAAGSADLTSITAVGTKGLTLNISGTSLATVDAAGVTGVGSAFTLAASTSDADMTVTASANRPTVSETGTANTITTGEGDDTVTGGAYKDVITTNDGDDTVTSGDGDDNITTGRGADTITAGDGDVTIDSGIGNDTVVAGDGDNTITLGSGDDTLTAGDGDNTITLGSGDDTVTTGSGDDVVVMSDYDDDDVIDLGTGTNVLLADALPTTGAYAAAADFVDISGDVEPQLSNIDALYLQHTTVATNDSAATKETIDFSSSTGLGALYLDIVDAEAADDSNYAITNFDGSQIHLSSTSGEPASVMSIDGTGQSSLTLKTYAYNDDSTGSAITVTQVDSLIIDTYETVTVSGTTSEVTNTALGAITADDVDTLLVKNDGQSSTLGSVVFTTGAISADSAQTLSFTTGSNGELVTGAITSTSNAVDAITLTAADDGILDITSINVAGSDLASLTITAGIGARIDEGTSSTTVLPITADSIEAATVTVGAAASAALSLLYAGTTTINLTTGSTLDLGDVGAAAKVSSTTVTGRATLQGTIDLLGEAAFNFSGLTSTSGASILVDGVSAGDKTITGNSTANVLLSGNGDNTITGGAGADTISIGSGDNTVTAGAGADKIGLNGRVETYTITYDAGDKVKLTLNGADTAVVTFATDVATAAAAVATAVNATTATTHATATSALGVVTVTYQSWEGVAGSATFTDAGILLTGGVAAAVSAAGTNSSGDDAISLGDGVDTYVYGGGADTINTGGNDGDADVIIMNADAADIAATWTDTAAGSTVDVSEAVILTGYTADKIDLAGSAGDFAAVNTATVTQVTTAATIGNADDVDIFTGTYDSVTGLFTSEATADATDLLVVYDNAVAGTADYSAIVLVGGVTSTGTVMGITESAAGVLTLGAWA